MYLQVLHGNAKKILGPFPSLQFNAEGEIKGPGLLVSKHKTWGSWFIETSVEKFFFDHNTLEILDRPER